MSPRRRVSEIGVYVRPKHPTPRRFLIFAQGRTGTWLMTHLLNSHPAIDCEKEILMYPKIAPLHYINARSRLHERQLYGCHVQVNQLLTAQKVKPRRFLQQAVDHGWQLIRMTRRDIVRQSISTILATRRRQWVAYERVEMEPQRIESAELLPWLQRRIDHAAIEADALRDLPHLSFVYEDDLRDAANHQATMDRVFAFLNLPSIPVQAQTKRLSGDLRQTITNYDDLLAFVRATPFAVYTDLC